MADIKKKIIVNRKILTGELNTFGTYTEDFIRLNTLRLWYLFPLADDYQFVSHIGYFARYWDTLGIAGDIREDIEPALQNIRNVLGLTQGLIPKMYIKEYGSITRGSRDTSPIPDEECQTILDSETACQPIVLGQVDPCEIYGLPTYDWAEFVENELRPFVDESLATVYAYSEGPYEGEIFSGMTPQGEYRVLLGTTGIYVFAI